jgi:hypothetical protein
MGLDITAYSRLKHVGKHADGWCDESYDDDFNRVHVQAFAYEDFPQSFRGIPVLGTKAASGSAFIDGGCFAVTAETKTHAFRAGSYGGYNAWRADLQRQFNPLRNADGPFYELIWFADNEGCIGPEAAKDLLADFREHADRYAPGEYEDYFRQKYQDWTTAFELAADGGLVDFH